MNLTRVSVEMRHNVTTPIYLFKKTLDNILYSLSSRSFISLSSLGPLLSRVPYPPGNPTGWIPLYTMITFRPDINYATAKKRAIRQASIIERLCLVLLALIGVTALWICRIALALYTQ